MQSVELHQLLTATILRIYRRGADWGLNRGAASLARWLPAAVNSAHRGRANACLDAVNGPATFVRGVLSPTARAWCVAMPGLDVEDVFKYTRAQVRLHRNRE